MEIGSFHLYIPGKNVPVTPLALSYALFYSYYSDIYFIVLLSSLPSECYLTMLLLTMGGFNWFTTLSRLFKLVFVLGDVTLLLTAGILAVIITLSIYTVLFNSMFEVGLACCNVVLFLNRFNTLLLLAIFILLLSFILGVMVFDASQGVNLAYLNAISFLWSSMTVLLLKFSNVLLKLLNEFCVANI